MIILESNAKINIGLNILEKLDDGYHSLDMIMVPISLADRIFIDFKNKIGNLKISSNNKYIPTDERNIIFKIYKEFYKYTNMQSEEIELYLEKKIPHQAGLGGGSSNGGFFLNELNKYHNNLLTEKELILIGKKIGADIPFFIKNEPCRVRGIGEKLEIIKNNLEVDIILIKPKFGVSTKTAYLMYGSLKNIKMANIDKIIEGLENNNINLVVESNENILEQGLIEADKNIRIFREKIAKIENENFFMSGSGSCYYVLSPKEKTSKTLMLLESRLNDCTILKCNFL